jgi:hypothetical protein
MLDFRKDFYFTWLVETPIRHSEPFKIDIITDELKEFVKAYSDLSIDEVNSNFKIFETPAQIFAWYCIPNAKNTDSITKIVALEKTNQGLVVTKVAKDPELAGHSKSAADLYLDILKYFKMPVRIASDKKLSDDANEKIWKELFNSGCNVSYYDNTIKPVGKTLTRINKLSDFDNLFGDNQKHKNFQYVVSLEEHIHRMVEGWFSIRRMIESTDTLCDEEYLNQKYLEE